MRHYLVQVVLTSGAAQIADMPLQIAPRPSVAVPKPRNQTVAKENKQRWWKKRWYKEAQRVQVAQYMWHYLV